MKTIKNLILIGLVLLTALIPTSAQTWGVIGLSGGGESPTCADCSGSTLFAWFMENVDVTLGTAPYCGCSDGDTTATASGSVALSSTITPYDGSAALYMSAGGQNYNFTITDGDIFDDSAFTITFYYYASTWGGSQKVVLAYLGGYTSSLQISTQGTNQFYAAYQGGGVTRAVYSPNMASPTGVWHKIVVSGRVGEYDPSLWISVDDSSPTSNQITNDDLSAMTADDGTLYVGSLDAGTYVAAIDKLSITNSYTTAP